MKSYYAPLLAVVLALALTPLANAAIWTEVGDAGDQVATAQATVGTGSLDMIFGEILITSFTDIYRITITNPAAFSASTVNAGTALDTQLFLFRTNGLGIAFNDDAPPGFPTEVRSTLPVGNPLYASLTPGEYLLAITTFDTDPFSAGFLDIFPLTSSGVHGPTGPGGAAPLAGWFNDPFSDFGTYRIDLTGAGFSQTGVVIPEPASLTLLALGAAGMAGYTWRRRKAVVK